MGLGSRLKKAVGGLIQKVHKDDPVFGAAMKYDPLAKQAFEDHFGPLGSGQIAPPPVEEQRMQMSAPARADAGWQMQRVAAMRAKYGRPGATPIGASTMPSAVPPTPVQPSGVKTIMPITTKPVTSMQPGTMAASPISTGPAPLNPAANDMAAYSQAWQTLA